MEKFKISATWIYHGLGYAGNGFLGWFRAKAAKLLLIENVDFVESIVPNNGGKKQSDRLVKVEAAEKLIMSTSPSRQVHADALLHKIRAVGADTTKVLADEARARGLFTLPHHTAEREWSQATPKLPGNYWTTRDPEATPINEWLRKLVLEDGRLILDDADLRNRELPQGVWWFGPVNTCSTAVRDYVRAEDDATIQLRLAAKRAEFAEERRFGGQANNRAIEAQKAAQTQFALDPARLVFGVAAPSMTAVQREQYHDLNVAPWSGAQRLYDPARVGELERDSATGSRRYQLRCTPTTKAVESDWLQDDYELEWWLRSVGACLNPLPQIHTGSKIGGWRPDGIVGEDVPNEETVGGQPAGSLEAAIAEIKANQERRREKEAAAESSTGIPVNDLVAVDAEPGVLYAGVDGVVRRTTGLTDCSSWQPMLPLPAEPVPLALEIGNTEEDEPLVPYAEWGRRALDLEVVPPNCPDPKFPVSARSLHAYLQIGKYFEVWIDGFELVEGEDYGVFTRSENPSIINPREYWLTSDTAQWMADECKTKRGSQVVDYLVAREIRLAALEHAGQPAAAEVGGSPPEGSVEDILHDRWPERFPAPAAEAVMVTETGSEWGLVALDLEVVPADCPNPKFPVKARPLHTFLQIGKYFANWMQDRIKEFKLVEGEDFGVIARFGNNPQGGRPSTEYWLTSDAAQWLAADRKSERGVQVIKYLTARNKRLTALEKVGQPAFNLPTTFAEALRLAADATEENERLTLTLGVNRQLLGVAAQDLSQAKANLTVKEEALAEEGRVNADLVALRALEAASLPLGEWFQRTFNDHGHGEITGRKVMSCKGLLNRELVRGCKNTREATIPSDMLDARKLIYSHACVDKMKRIKKDGPVVPIIDADGKPVKIEPRVILVTPDYMEDLAKWFMTSDETMLRRLTHTRKKEEIYRLKGRYSFYDHDTRSQENLSEEQLFHMVTLVKPTAEDPLYRAYCNVRDNGKEGDHRVVYGEGKTLERALYDLAEHYLDGRK